jgi:MFS family permease
MVAGYLVTGSWGWVLYSYGAVLQLLRAEQGTVRAITGVHSLGLAAGSVVTGLLADRLVRRLGRRRLLVAAFATAAVGVCAFCLPLGPAWTVPSALVLGIGGSMTIVAWLPVAGLTFGAAAPAVLSRWLAGSAAVGIVAPLAIGAAVASGRGWRSGWLVAVGLFGAAVALLLRVPAGTPALDAPAPASREGAPEHGARGRGIPRRARRPVALVVTLIAIEFCCTAWVADLLAQRTGLSLAAAASAVTAVLAGMTVARAVVGRLALVYQPRLLLAASFLLTVVGWAVAWFVTAPAPALAGLLVVGLGIGGQYPLGVGLVLEAAPGAEDRTAGAMSVGIGVSSGLGPFVLGALADARGTHAAFLVVPVLVAACLLLLGVPPRPARLGQRRGRAEVKAIPATTAAARATAPQGNEPLLPSPASVREAAAPAGEACRAPEAAGEADGRGEGDGRAEGDGRGEGDRRGESEAVALGPVAWGVADADSAARNGAATSTRSTGSPAPSDASRTDRPSGVSASPSP